MIKAEDCFLIILHRLSSQHNLCDLLTKSIFTSVVGRLGSPPICCCHASMQQHGFQKIPRSAGSLACKPIQPEICKTPQLGIRHNQPGKGALLAKFIPGNVGCETWDGGIVAGAVLDELCSIIREVVFRQDLGQVRVVDWDHPNPASSEKFISDIFEADILYQVPSLLIIDVSRTPILDFSNVQEHIMINT